MSKNGEADISGYQREERLFARISEPLLITDTEGLIQYINPALEKMTGYRMSELLGVPIFRLVPKREIPCLKKLCVEADGDRRGAILRMRLLMKNERERGALISCSVLDDDGPSRRRLFLVRDESRIEGEDPTRKYLEAAVGHISEGVIIITTAGRIIFANHAVSAMSGYSTDELEGKNISMLHPPDIRNEWFREVFHRTLAGGWEGELPVVNKNGARFDVLLFTRPLVGRDGKTGAILGILKDVTEQEDMRLRLDHTNQELSTLYAISSTLTEYLEMDELITISLEKVLEVMDMDVGVVRVLDDATDELVLKAYKGTSPDYVKNYARLKVEDSVSGQVLKTGVPYFVTRENEAESKRIVIMQEGLAHATIVPLRSKFKALGTISVGGFQPRTSISEDLKLLTSMGSIIGVALEHSLVFEKADALAREKEEKVEELSLLMSISHALMTTIRLDKLLYIVLTSLTMGESFGFNRAAILLVSWEEGVIQGEMGVGPVDAEEAGRIWAELGRKEHSLMELVDRAFDVQGAAEAVPNRAVKKVCISLDNHDDVVVQAMREKKPLIIADAGSNPHMDPHMLALLMGGDEFAVVPILAQENPLGVILVDNVFNKKPITTEDVELLMVFANQAGLAIENSILYSHQERINRKLREAQAKLLQQAKLVGLGEMAAEVAHEIRNPLVSIGGFARKISENIEENPKLKQYADIVLSEVIKLEATLNNVLSLSRSIPPKFADVNLNGVIRDAMDLVTDDINEKNIRLVMNLDDDLPILEADAMQLRQVFTNLFINAIQVMDTGGTLEVATATEMIGEKTYIKTEVSDTGQGIPSELLGDIFKPFFTTKSSGTGLGLAIAHKIISNHGGNIDIINRPGGGATFVVELPRSQEISQAV
ncbi:MAG: PAS domain S-box protein [Deltaproteobacteria bacterium]|nr:PAS domain S-box protein [Candidatus Zymogenaceae bacterium]